MDFAALELDAKEREELARKFVVRRPHASMAEQLGHADFARTHSVYLVRLAQLTTVQNGRAVWAPAGNCFPDIVTQNIDLYAGQYVAKFGHTTRTCKAKLREVVDTDQREVFQGVRLDPLLAMALVGAPHDKDVLLALEKGLRNRFARGHFRLNQHATGPAENPESLGGTWGFVRAEPGCKHIFAVFDAFCNQLNDARREVMGLVRERDQQRAQEIAAGILLIQLRAHLRGIFG